MIATVVVYFKHNIFYGLVIIWAVYGIIMKVMEKGDAYYHSLVYLGAFGIILILLAVIKTAVTYSTIQEKPYREERRGWRNNTFKNTMDNEP